MLKNIDNYETGASLEKAAQLSLLYLIGGKGYPPNWNSSNVQLVGLTDDLNVISPAKFNELMKISNSSLSDVLGAPEFNVLINLTKTDGTTINSTGLPPSNSSNSAVVESYVVFNNALSNIYVTVWK